MTAVRRTSIREVAQDSGVSRQTVSNVLNYPDRVAAATRDRVLDSIDRLGYRPDRGARNLVARRAGLIGYCLGHNGPNAVMDDFLRALCVAAEGAGNHVLLFTATPGLDGMPTYTDLVAQRAVDAFVLADVVDHDPRHEWLAAHGIPFASFGRTWPDAGGQPGPWVDVDGAAACADLVGGLHRLGHRRIAFLHRVGATGAVLDRARGHRDRCAALGLPPQPIARATADTAAAGRHAVRALLDLPDPPTAVVAASDHLAIGALAADPALAVTGFDDTPMAAATDPPLTSVRQPVAVIAATLMSLLADPVDARGVLLPGTIVSRASAPVSPFA